MWLQVNDALGEGSVTGVIPHELKPRELSGASIGTLETVDNMHQRKVPHKQRIFHNNFILRIAVVVWIR